MSHLDNESKENKLIDEEINAETKRKKPFFTKKKIALILVIFSVICIGVTIGAIYFTKNKQKVGQQPTIETPVAEEKVQKEQIIPDGLGVKSYFDKYTTNGLKITTEKYNYGDQISQTNEWGYTNTYYHLETEYDQIDGLENTQIQDEINTEIKEILIKQMDNIPQNDKSYHIYINVTGNFSNVICFKIFSYGDGDEFERVKANLNYDLSTGEKIKFEDLFTNTANIKHILSQSAYTALSYSKSAGEGGPGIDMTQVDYSGIQDKIFEMINKYNSNKELDFYFTAQAIYCTINNEIIEIPMRDFYESIAIYNRYANKPVKYKYPTKEQPVFLLFSYSNPNNEIYYYQFEKIADNLFVDIRIDTEDIYYGENEEPTTTEEEKTIVDKYIIKEINYRIEKCKQYLKNNSNKAIVYVATVATHMDSGKICAETDFDRIITDIDYYKSTFLEYMIKQEQNRWGTTYQGGAYNYYYIDDRIKEHIELIDENYTTYGYEQREYNIPQKTFTITETDYDINLRKDVTKSITTYNAETGEEISKEFPVPENQTKQTNITVETNTTINNTTQETTNDTGNNSVLEVTDISNVVVIKSTT